MLSSLEMNDSNVCPLLCLQPTKVKVMIANKVVKNVICFRVIIITCNVWPPAAVAVCGAFICHAKIRKLRK
jgi:nitrate reductase NapE component